MSGVEGDERGSAGADEFGNKLRLATAKFSLAVLFFGLALLATWTNTLQRPWELRWNSWAYSELLINYRGGFVRRGFLGEVLALLGCTDTVSINRFVFLVFVAFVVLVALHAVWLRTRYRSLTTPLIWVLIPGSVYSFSVGNEYYYRKEMIFYLFILSLALLARHVSTGRKTTSSQPASIALWMFVISGSIPLILIHEAFLFLCLPAVLLLMMNVFPPHRHILGWVFPISYVVVLCAMFLLLVLYRGNEETVSGIWASIGPENRSLISASDTPGGGIAALGWSLPRALGQPWQVVSSGEALSWLVPLVISIAGVLCYSSVKSAGDDRSTARGFVTYLLILIGTVPLYVLGWDWGRWLSGANLISLAVIPAVHILPRSFDRLLGMTERTLGAAGRQRYVLYSFLVVAIFHRLPECCIARHGQWVFRSVESTLRMLMESQQSPPW
jgi:hypothetical protein